MIAQVKCLRPLYCVTITGALMLLLGASVINQSSRSFLTAPEKERRQAANVYLQLGAARCQHKQWLEAINAYNEAIRLNSTDAAAHYGLGFALAKLWLWDEAIGAYTAAVRLKPDYAAAHLGMGYAQLKTYQHARALKSYLKVLELEPVNAAAHLNLGNLYCEIDRHDEAIKSFRRAVALSPRNPNAYYDLALCLAFDRGDIHAALKEYRILKTLDAHLAAQLYALLEKHLSLARHETAHRRLEFSAE